MKYCPMCGGPVSPDSKFCTQCGHALQAAVAPGAAAGEATPKADPTPQPTYHPPGDSPADAAPPPSSEPAGAMPSGSSAATGWPLGRILLASVAVAAAITGIVFIAADYAGTYGSESVTNSYPCYNPIADDYSNTCYTYDTETTYGYYNSVEGGAIMAVAWLGGLASLASAGAAAVMTWLPQKATRLVSLMVPGGLAAMLLINLLGSIGFAIYAEDVGYNDWWFEASWYIGWFLGGAALAAALVALKKQGMGPKDLWSMGKNLRAPRQ